MSTIFKENGRVVEYESIDILDAPHCYLEGAPIGIKKNYLWSG